MYISRAFAIAVVLCRPRPRPLPGCRRRWRACRRRIRPARWRSPSRSYAREPSNARAWRVLGIAAKGTKELDRALAALQKSMEIEPANPVGLYNTGAVYALKGDGSRVRMARQGEGDAEDRHDADRQRRRPRRRCAPTRASTRSCPAPADFAEPFVENVKILREWDGEAMPTTSSDGSRAPIGDVDRDGVTDIVTSAPGSRPAARRRAASTSTRRRPASCSGRWTATAGDQLGTGVEAAGDTNKDGVPDVIASAPGSGQGLRLLGQGRSRRC